MIEPIFLNDWASCTSIDVFKEFDEDRWSSYREEDATPVQDKRAYQGVEILLAAYGYENYSGDAFVLFRRDGQPQLYEVNGSHCSCYGLEGQWDPEETTIDALRHRMKDGDLGNDKWSENQFAAELATLLDALERE